MEPKTTLIYYTDGCVEDSIAKLAQAYILKANLPIISVSQKPMDFGENYCIGEIGRSYENIQSQILVGLGKATTEYVALCEHDTIYPEGYFDFIPTHEGVFFYNRNRIFVVAKKGPQYGEFIKFQDANPNADQLICNRKLLIEATLIRRDLLARCSISELPRGWSEPGYSLPHEKFTWRHTKKPSIDILHNNNFTVRGGQYRPDELSMFAPGWGSWDDVIKGAEV